LTRPQRSLHFTKNEVRTAKTISPYLAYALAHNDLRRQVMLRGSILDYIEKISSVGMILLDETLHVIYSNQKAEEFLEKWKGTGSAAHSKDQIFSRLLEDCRETKSRLKDCPAGGIVIPKKRVLIGPHSSRFSVCSKTFDHWHGWEGSRLFMVCIEEMTEPAGFSRQHLMDAFHLSKREIQVASHLFSGLTNAEIGEKLFIGETTVKKHLQSIYAKVGVKNRTSLINKMLPG
jgi:DNA-binding CsgD family transcriptional regulator